MQNTGNMTRLLGVVVFGWVLGSSPVQAGHIGDVDQGQKVFEKCMGCHRVGPEAMHRIGPHLNGLFGRKAASLDDYKYSDAMRRAGADGLIWELDKLEAYLENPKVLVTGTKMTFRGLENHQDRMDVLAYLRQFSDRPQDIPEASPTAIAPEVQLSPEVLALAGDPEYGEYLSGECQTCHQVDGDDDGIPSITQWPTEEFVIAMHGYKQKLRPHPVMQMMAGRLSDDAIAALAAYFGALE